MAHDSDPVSREIPVPDTLQVVCPTHGPIATLLMGPDYDAKRGLHWVLRCPSCGRSCDLETA